MRTTKLVIRQKNTEPIRFDKRVECKVECNMVECNNVLSCVGGIFLGRGFNEVFCTGYFFVRLTKLAVRQNLIIAIAIDFVRWFLLILEGHSDQN